MGYSDETYNLRINLDTKHYECTAEEITRMERALDPLARVAEQFPVSDLHVTVIHHPRTKDFHVKTSLVLSGRTLFTGERHRDMYSAYEQCVDKLVRKVQTYKSHLEGEDVQSKIAKGTHHEVLPTQVPDHEAIDKALAEGDYPAFRRATLVYEEPVRKRIGRWVQRYPDLQEQIGERFEIADLVEDLFLTAFDRFEEKSADVPMGDWLEALIDDVVHAVADHPDEELENVSMARSARDVDQG